MALSVVQEPAPRPRGEASAAAEALHDSPEEFLDCRDLRHPWQAIGVFYVQKPGKPKEVHRKLVCTRCGTEATDRWKPNGQRIARQYKYVEGYQAEGAHIRPVDVRKEVLTRVTVYATEEDMLTSLFSPSRGRKRA